MRDRSLGFYQALAQVERLLPAYRGRTVLTRYVPPKVPSGAWIPYFDMFPSLLRPEGDPLWDLKLPAPHGAFLETRTTFSKWDEPMAALTGQGAPIAVCGSRPSAVCSAPSSAPSITAALSVSSRTPAPQALVKRRSDARDPRRLRADGQRGEDG
ncbi:MAG TPA: hypothetical protein VGG79_21835 [Roseiarcus sp.]|jgi:hypothetical protein